MADKDNKKVDPYEVFYHIFLFAAVIGFAVCGFLDMNGQYIYAKGVLFSGYTAGFLGGALLMGVRLVTILNRSKWKFGLRTYLLAAAVVIALVFGINSFSVDKNRSRLIDTLTLAEKTEDTGAVLVLLSEYTAKPTDGTDTGKVTMDVYRTGGRFAKKIGSIDETYFSNRCVESDSYSYTYTEEGDLILECNYGYYGGGFVNLVNDTGSLTYTFKVK